MSRPHWTYRLLCALGLHDWLYTRERDARACLTCPRCQRMRPPP